MSLKTKYNPQYDPLVDATPGSAQDYAPSYWADSLGKPPPPTEQLSEDIQADVVVIGSGFTGLSTAYHLAKEHNIQVVVLEANQIAWGCTSRNGGQGQNASGRLSRGQWIKKWGLETAQNLHAEISDAYGYFKQFALDDAIACQPQGEGHLLIAHKDRAMKDIQNINEVNNTYFGYKSRVVSADELHRDFVKEQGSKGALLEPDGIGVHPLKLACGILEKLQQAGGKVYTGSPVIGWEEQNGMHILHTPQAKVQCKKVAIATGGYTHHSLHKQVAYKYMPILSNSVVTRPLSEEEIQACNFKTNLVITDTRVLRFYYRLLADNRLQMGTRSAIHGKEAPEKVHYDLLVQGLEGKFPALKNIQIDYSWSGWVDVSHDMMPRVVQAEEGKNIFYAFGYGGNGVSFSLFAGKKMAQLLAGEKLQNKQLPIYDSPLPGHFFRPFRRLGQRLLYKYYFLQDLL